jgi:adenylate cyclase
MQRQEPGQTSWKITSLTPQGLFQQQIPFQRMLFDAFGEQDRDQTITADQSKAVGTWSAEPADPPGIRVMIQNHGDFPLRGVWTDEVLLPGHSRSFSLPFLIQAGDSWIEFRNRDLCDGRSFEVIECPHDPHERAMIPIGLLDQAPSARTLAAWFEAIAGLMKHPAYAPEFLQEAAQRIRNPGGLDMGLIFVRKQWLLDGAASPQQKSTLSDDLILQAWSITSPEFGVAYDTSAVTHACLSRRTIYHSSPATTPKCKEHRGAEASVVASPIMAGNGELLGVIYGARLHRGTNKRRSIRSLEALWTQLLGASIGASLQRAKAELEAAQTKTLLEQVFCPEVARRIVEEPRFLQGQSRDITVLFADLRDSTALTGSIPTQEAYRLLGEVLDSLTNCVLKEAGVIVDYHGDGLAAMWNAPLDQADHSIRGARTALEMVHAMRELNHRWELKLGLPLRLAIGLHSGMAEVGNAGSSRRLKYGPRGSTVNLASRLEMAAKKTEAPIVVSQEFVKRLPSSAIARRLGKARFAGFSQPIPIAELHALESADLVPKNQRIIAICEKALELVDNGQTHEAIQMMESVDPSSTDFSHMIPFWRQQFRAWNSLAASGPFEIDFSSR